MRLLVVVMGTPTLNEDELANDEDLGEDGLGIDLQLIGEDDANENLVERPAYEFRNVDGMERARG